MLGDKYMYVFRYRMIFLHFIFFYIYLVNLRPSKKKILDIVNYVAPHWYELGIRLLNEGQESRLDSIKSDIGPDSKKCCIEMFWYWLESHPEATWQDLLESLRSQALELHNTAATIEAKIGKYILVQNYGNASSYMF